MSEKTKNPLRMAPLQTLEPRPVEDPAEIALLEKAIRLYNERSKPRRTWPAWIGAIVVALAVGILVGRFLL
jgi:hypothetical protein